MVGTFRPTSDHDLQVGADLSFADTATGANHGSIRASWLDHHYNHARFQPGQTHDLLIAFASDASLSVSVAKLNAINLYESFGSHTQEFHGRAPSVVGSTIAPPDDSTWLVKPIWIVSRHSKDSIVATIHETSFVRQRPN